jgi:hypothetical protein
VDCVRGCKGAQGRLPAFKTPRCHNRGGKAAGPSQDRVWAAINQVYMPPYSSHIMSATIACDTTTTSQNGPHDYRGTCKA